MNINELIKTIKIKIQSEIEVENIIIEDKSFLHKNHKTNQKDRFHIKLSIKSKKLTQMNKIDANKKIYKILSKEMNSLIHSLQILIS